MLVEKKFSTQACYVRTYEAYKNLQKNFSIPLLHLESEPTENGPAQQQSWYLQYPVLYLDVAVLDGISPLAGLLVQIEGQARWTPMISRHTVPVLTISH